MNARRSQIDRKIEAILLVVALASCAGAGATPDVATDATAPRGLDAPEPLDALDASESEPSEGGGDADADAATCVGRIVGVGDDLQAAIDASPEGATLCLSAGVHRLASAAAPKANQTLWGAPGAVLSGAKVLGGFVHDARGFVADGFLPPTPSGHGECVVAGCTITQDVFVDDVRLTRALSLADLAPGRFYEDFTTSTVVLFDDPTGKRVEQAFASALLRGPADGVTVRGLIVEKAANEAQTGAIAPEPGSGWRIVDDEVRWNHGVGIAAFSSIVQRDHVHHQGQLGVSGHGDANLFEDDEIDHNDVAGYATGWEAGGSKFATPSATHLVARKNFVHDNDGPGLWCDVECFDATFEGNLVVDNTGPGIFYEISYRARIHGNVVMRNSPSSGGAAFYLGGQIVVSASPDVEVDGNVVSGANGIGILQQKRGIGGRGAHEAHDVFVHDNVITQVGEGFAAGLSEDVGDASYFLTRDNRFVANTYHLAHANGAVFTWLDAPIDAAAWRADGQDVTGVFLSP